MTEVDRIGNIERWEKDNLCGICPYRKAVQAENDRLKASIAAATAEGYADGLHAGRDESRGAVEALQRIVWAENRGPDGAAESAYMVQVARDALSTLGGQ